MNCLLSTSLKPRLLDPGLAGKYWSCRATGASMRPGGRGTSPWTSGPAAVVFPESAAEVAAAVRYAAGHGLRIAAQGTGHNAGPLGRAGGTVLLRTERMRGIRIDPRAGPPGSRPAWSGWTSSTPPPRTGSPRSRARRRTSAWPATPSAAA